MSVKRKSFGSVQVLELDGEFTMSDSKMPRALDLRGRQLTDLGQVLGELLDRGQYHIILDLSRVKFIDSAGLGELIAWKKRTAERGGDIRLLQPARKVQELLVMTLLTQLFEVYDTEAEAVGSFAVPDGAAPRAPVGPRPSPR